MARVLVVDDDQDLLQLVVSRLRQAGHQAAGAATAAKALELVAQRGAPEVAVLDVSLPDMNGYDLLTRLRGEAPTGHMPAVFVSGRVGQADIDAGQANERHLPDQAVRGQRAARGHRPSTDGRCRGRLQGRRGRLVTTGLRPVGYPTATPTRVPTA